MQMYRHVRFGCSALFLGMAIDPVYKRPRVSAMQEQPVFPSGCETIRVILCLTKKAKYAVLLMHCVQITDMHEVTYLRNRIIFCLNE